MDLDKLKVYQMAMEIGELCWNIVDEWNYFQRDTIGKQLVRSADSIAANISEGYGRYHFKENKNFNFYARGSLFETKTWIIKAHRRGFVDETIYLKLKKELNNLGYLLNRYIKSIGSTHNSEVKEPKMGYNNNLPEDSFDIDSISFPDDK